MQSNILRKPPQEFTCVLERIKYDPLSKVSFLLNREVKLIPQRLFGPTVTKETKLFKRYFILTVTDS